MLVHLLVSVFTRETNPSSSRQADFSVSVNLHRHFVDNAFQGIEVFTDGLLFNIPLGFRTLNGEVDRQILIGVLEDFSVFVT